MKKTMLGIFLIISIMMLLIPASADYDDSGKCGENVEWQYNGMAIIISGSGDMENYDKGREPYFKYHDDVHILTVNDGITSIGDSAFRGLGLVSRVNIGKNVTCIGDYAFSIIFRLKEITLPESLKEIGEYAFSHCSQLESIKIPEGVEEIKQYTFEHCEALKTVEIPSTVTKLDLTAFEECNALENINVADGNSAYYSIDGSLYAREGDALLLTPKGKKTVEAVPGITSIPDKAYFDNYSLQSFDVPEGVTSIGEWAFGNCRALKSVTLPEGLVEIKDGAFLCCDNLNELKIPSTVKLIGKDAFAGATISELEIPSGVKRLESFVFGNTSSMVKLILPEGIEYIGDRSFLGCGADIYFRGSEEQWNAIEKHKDAGLPGINKIHFNYEEKTITLPDDAVKIMLYGKELVCDTPPVIVNDRTLVPVRAIFEGLGKYITWAPQTQTVAVFPSRSNRSVPEFTLTIGYYDFIALINRVKRVVKLDVPAQIINDRTMVPLRAIAETLDCEVKWDEMTRTVTIDKPAANKCGYDAYWALDEDGTLTISGNGYMYDSYSYIDNNKDKIKRVVIEKGITRIGKSAFSNCKKLESVEIPNTVNAIGTYAFSGCSSLKSIVIPDSVSDMESDVFMSCSSLETAEIGGTTTRLEGAFRNCTALKNVILPDTLTKLYSTFEGCTSLETAEIPKGVKEIVGAFNGCKNLKSIIIPDSVTYIGYETFKNCDSLMGVTLPEGLEKIGNYAFCGCSQLKKINIPSTVTEYDSGVFWGCEDVEITNNRKK